MRSFLLLTVACTGPEALVPGTVDDDPTLPRLELDDTVLRGEVVGSPYAPLAVLLHGGPGADVTGMLPLQALADDGFQVLAYDQRGSGLSRRHDRGSVSVDQLVADLEHLIEAHAPDGKAVLIGHSWGGQLATAMVQAHPERVEATVLLDPGPFTGARWETLGLATIDMTADHLNELFWAEQMVSPDGHARLDWHFQQLLAGQLDGYNVREDDPMPYPRFGFVAYEDVLGSAMIDGQPAWDFEAGLDDWTGTAHFVWGGANTLMGPDYRRVQEAAYPRSTTLTLDGIGHDLPWVASEALVTHTLEVL